MKRILILLFLITLLAGVFPQSTDTLDELRLFVKSALIKAEQEARRSGAETLVWAGLFYNDREPLLGNLMGDLLLAEVTNRSPLNWGGTQFEPSDVDPGVVISGVAHVVESLVYMQLIVTGGTGDVPAAVVEKTMEYASLGDLLSYNFDDKSYGDALTEDYFLEPNDRIEDSIPFDVGDSIEMALTPGDKDWFYFELDESYFEEDAFMVEIYTTGATDTYMEVYGPDNTGTFYGESDDYYDSNAGMVLTMDAPGIYWVLIRGYSEDVSGYYYLESFGEPVAFADSYEPDNTWEQATEVTWDEEQVHAFSYGDKMDAYFFEMESPGDVVLITKGDLDTYMDLYDEMGNYIVGDDDGGKDANARIEMDLPRGLYYLEVRPYEEGSDGEYVFSAHRE